MTRRMTRCEILRENNVALAAMPEDDPERIEAYRHASGCSGCADALAQGVALLGQLELPVSPPAPALLLQTQEAIFAQWDDAPAPHPSPVAPALIPSGSRPAWGLRLGLGTVALAVWAILLVTARKTPSDTAIWIESAIGAALAAMGLIFAITFGPRLRELAGRVRRPGLGVTFAATLAVAFAVFAGRALFTAGGLAAEGFVGGWELLPLLGLKCAVLELVGAAPLVGIAAYFIRRRGADGVSLGAIGAFGALAVQSALHVTCPAQNALPHLLVFHVGGVLLSAGIAAWIGRRLARARRPGAAR